jgi:hypothetical protein
MADAEKIERKGGKMVGRWDNRIVGKRGLGWYYG